MSPYDVVLIGSGLSSLACATLLSREGMRVLVLEKEPTLGGCLASFVRSGVRFDTGMHYIGSAAEGEYLFRHLALLGLSDLPLRRLAPEAADVIHFRGTAYPFAQGYEPFFETLSRYFPHSRKALSAHLDALRRVAERLPFHAFDPALPNVIPPEVLQVDVPTFLSRHIDDSRLAEVLSAYSVLYGGVRERTPAYLHILTADSHIRSAFRIAGGSIEVVRRLVAGIRAHGGEVLSRRRVTRISLDDYRRVAAVTTADGTSYPTRRVISGIHPKALLPLLPPDAFRPAFRSRIASLSETMGSFVLYLRFRGQSVPYLNQNVFRFRSSSVWDAISVTSAAWPSHYLYMHLCPSDPSARFAEGAEVMCPMPWRDVAQWSTPEMPTATNHRPEGYRAFKAACTRRLLDILLSDYPDLRPHILSVEASTPLTLRDYTHTTEGGTYGILRDVRQIPGCMLMPPTRVGGLFLTGQNTAAHGFAGTVISAEMAAAAARAYIP